MSETYAYHETLYFRTDTQNECESLLHYLLKSQGQRRTHIVNLCVNSMIVFFINTFLTMYCLSGYNETNVNRLLINYSPSASDSINESMIYPMLKKFKNLYWASSNLLTWDSYGMLSAVLNHKVPLTFISMADVTITLIFMISTGLIKVNPMYFKNFLTGNPFYIKHIISQYWFLRGLRYKEVYEFKFQHCDRMERRKIQYMNQCSKKAHK